MSNAQPTSKPTVTEPGAKTNEPAKMVDVARICLKYQTDLPHKAVTDVLQATARAKVFDAAGKRINHQQAWLIEYTPAHRNFRIVYYPPGAEKEEEEFNVPETAVKGWKRA